MKPSKPTATGNCLRLVILALVALINLQATSVRADVKPNPLIEAIVQWHYDACQARVDLRAEDKSDRSFRYDPQNIYDIDLGQDVIGTVVYRAFTCEGEGKSWCGSGGCGYFIVVDDQIFGRSGGFPPEMISPVAMDIPILLMPIHGGACEGVSGENISGFYTCYLTATWNNDQMTFQSYERTYPLDLYELVDGVLARYHQ